MDRRYIIFMVLVVAILGAHMALRTWLVPAPPPPVAKKDKDVKKEKGPEEKKGPAEEKKGKEPGEEKNAKPGPENVAEEPAGSATHPHERVTLGSVNAKGVHEMLITLNSLGAAVERVELSREKYRDIDYFGGYLGELALEDSDSKGAKVTVVGAGTPAALAKEASGKTKGGIEVGDMITALAGKDMADAGAIGDYLQKHTLPGETIEVAVSRKVAGKANSLKFNVTLDRRPLQLISPEVHIHKDGVEADPLSFLFTLESLGEKSVKSGEEELRGLPSLRKRDWKLDKHTEDMAEYSLTLKDADLKGLGQSGPIRLIKRYVLAKAEKSGDANYHLMLQVEIHNEGQEKIEVAYRQEGPNGLPLEGWWYSNKLHPKMWDGAGARDIAWKLGGERQGHQLLGCPRIYTDAKEAIKDNKVPENLLLSSDQAEPIDYIGVDTQFFAAMMLPQPQGNGPLLFRRAVARPVQDVTKVDKQHMKTTNVSVALVSPATTLDPGTSLKNDFQVFLGPKDPKILAQYGVPGKFSLGPLIETGWPVFAYPAWILQKILHGIYSVTQNYGIAIILLTVLVRSCMIPMSLKQAKSAAKMQELAPEMTKIKEKFKDDMEKQSAALKELYARHNFNPFGGCLLVFIQLPVFIGLYRSLSVDIELRDADLIPGFFWASNLAGPDRLLYWKDFLPSFLGDEAYGYLGPFCNVLPVITCALFILQQKMFTPPATDEQTALQQKLMMYMTVFMGVMFFKVPAGLCIYFITSSLWSVMERTFITKSKPAKGGDPSGAAKSAVKASPNGSTGTGGGTKVKRK